MPLINAATAKEYLPELSGTTQDALLVSIIARVETEFSRLLGFPRNGAGSHTLDQSTYTIYLDGPMWIDSDVLSLPVRPLVSVTSIHSDPDRVYGSDKLIDSSNYALDLEQGRVILKPNVATSIFDRSFRAIKVICVAGFSTSSPPADLVHAIGVQVALIFKNRPNIGVDSITQRQASIKVHPLTIPDEVKHILLPLRNADLIL